MLSKKYINLQVISVLFILVTTSQAQDSWTENWQLIWEYSSVVADTDTVLYFDIYKGLSNNPTQLYLSVDSSMRAHRDTDVQPNSTYYYRVKARDYMDLSSDYSNNASGSIPYIMETMDEIKFASDTSIYLNNYAVDKDLNENQYQDSLSWLINDGLSYTTPDNKLTIEITSDDYANFTVTGEWTGFQSAYFTVVDQDSFYYKKQIEVMLRGTESPPLITSGLDTIFIQTDSSLYLNDYVIDQDLTEDQYQDSLQWLVNDEISYTTPDLKLKIDITDEDSAKFDISSDWTGPDVVFFTVIDPDSLYDNKQVTIKFGQSQAPDTSSYDPDKEYIAYPIPFRGSTQSEITFSNIPPSGKVVVFNVMGGPVYVSEILPGPEHQWNVKNNDNKDISAGLYIYHVMDGTGKKVGSGKLVILR